jgi:hypothetical protein
MNTVAGLSTLHTVESEAMEACTSLKPHSHRATIYRILTTKGPRWYELGTEHCEAHAAVGHCGWLRQFIHCVTLTGLFMTGQCCVGYWEQLVSSKDRKNDGTGAKSGPNVG